MIETILNNRKIKIITFSTESNWMAGIPDNNWACILIDNDREQRYIDEVNSKIIGKNVCYYCAVGKNCERNHDLMDEEIVFREVDIDDHYLPDYLIRTTWHKDFKEGIFFGIFAAANEEVGIDQVVILDMTNGKELERIVNILGELKNV